MESPLYLCRDRHRQPRRSGGRSTYAKNRDKEGLCLSKKGTSKHSPLAHCTDPRRASTAPHCLGGPGWGLSGWGRGCRSPLWTLHSLCNGVRTKTKKREEDHTFLSTYTAWSLSVKASLISFTQWIGWRLNEGTLSVLTFRLFIAEKRGQIWMNNEPAKIMKSLHIVFTFVYLYRVQNIPLTYKKIYTYHLKWWMIDKEMTVPCLVGEATKEWSRTKYVTKSPKVIMTSIPGIATFTWTNTWIRKYTWWCKFNKSHYNKLH